MGAPSNAKWKRLGSLSKQDNSRQRIGNAHSVPHWKKKKQGEITEKERQPCYREIGRVLTPFSETSIDLTPAGQGQLCSRPPGHRTSSAVGKAGAAITTVAESCDQ